MWNDIKERIRALPSYRELTQALESAGSSVSAYGLTGGARSLVLACLAETREVPLLVVASDPVTARDVEEDLRIFGVEGIVSYPEDEILPYDYHDPDRDLTGLQMRALDALSEERCTVLITTPSAILRKVFTPEYYRSLLINLVKGEENDPTSLAGRLVRLGYERHGIVEEKGQFSLRGGILDLFAVGETVPVRMEYDGDEIVSMRTFDIETQRSTEERESLLVHPLHHLVPDGEGLGKLRRWFDRRTACMNEEETTRAMMPLTRLERGISFFGMEHYAAVVHDVVPIFSYFQSNPLIVLFDAEDVEGAVVQLRGEIIRRHENSRDEGMLYPEPADVYMGEEDFQNVLGRCGVLEIRRLGRVGSVRFSSRQTGDYRRNLKGLLRDVKRVLAGGANVFLFCSNQFQRDRAEELLSDVALEIDFPIGDLSGGVSWPDVGVLLLSEAEVFGRYHRPYHTKRSRRRSLTYDPSHFSPGDFVVHVNHGIGRYMGTRMLEIEGGQTECLDIRYEGDDHLFIPVAQLRMVEKYAAAEGAEPPLNKLGSVAWTKAQRRARESAERIARDLLEIYAARQIATGFPFEADKPWQKEMEASFPFEETPHQLRATAEVKNDLEAARPMDRLLCGDVGFGKTEVAVRAAFKAVLSGKQCALLVPTTVLALQHYNTVIERLQGYPVNTAMLSRFLSSTKQKQVVGQITAGTADIVVGTHRLLSKDVTFKDLGLVIIDEEHRFGVRHKETFKKRRRSVDVLSMTATPIPRTLSMAISGIRDISVIDTPPRNRLPIHTEILPFDDERIREAVVREVGRGGQVFFVHNRVQSIAVMEGYLRRLLPPSVTVSHAHGQMKERELERKMIDFLERRFDVLVCTMIIEAGLDFPNVNTIIINRSDKFGLAQLYQLRGRVGRSDRKAYAYLLVPIGRTMTPAAVKRLQAISEFDYLGAGYRIAMRDLEIRGAGNLLGPQQSGHINAVGLDLYAKMLREEVSRLKGEPIEEEREVKMSVPLEAYLPERYVADSEERMDIYRRLARMSSPDAIAELRDELNDRFGRLPSPAENMLKMVMLRVRALAAGVERIDMDARGKLAVWFTPGGEPAREVLPGIVETFGGRIEFQTDRGFSLVVSPAVKGAESADKDGHHRGRRGEGAVKDIESLLNLLEFYDK
jgi:transcription-repair coupling factor (superfamily II helicase)